MRLRLLASVLLVFVLGFAACGDDEADEGATGTGSATAAGGEEGGDHAEAAQTEATLAGGAAEVPAPGDPDGKGTAKVRLDSNKNEVCYEIEVEAIAAPTAAHIHEGAAGASGGILVTFDPTKIGGGEACVNVDHAIIDRIVANPPGFYVNVHNAEFPGGAIRGQLEKSA
jgi:hypothetical protein